MIFLVLALLFFCEQSIAQSEPTCDSAIKEISEGHWSIKANGVVVYGEIPKRFLFLGESRPFKGVMNSVEYDSSGVYFFDNPKKPTLVSYFNYEKNECSIYELENNDQCRVVFALKGSGTQKHGEACEFLEKEKNKNWKRLFWKKRGLKIVR